MDELSGNRRKIDLIDRKLLKLVAQRMTISRIIGRYKKSHHLKIRDPDRERTVLAKRISLAKKYGLPQPFVRKFFNLVLKQSRLKQTGKPNTGFDKD